MSHKNRNRHKKERGLCIQCRQRPIMDKRDAVFCVECYAEIEAKMAEPEAEPVDVFETIKKNRSGDYWPTFGQASS